MSSFTGIDVFVPGSETECPKRISGTAITIKSHEFHSEYVELCTGAETLVLRADQLVKAVQNSINVC